MVQDGDTALHNGTARDSVEVVQALVNCGAAVDIRNKVYIQLQHNSIVRLLAGNKFNATLMLP
jgi:hypothetical protein